VKDLYKENYKSLKKKVADYRRWKDLSCLWIGRINIVAMNILPKTIYMLNVIPVKIPVIFITEIGTSTLKFICKHKRL
jgi:REP element-mobilizing transposase RayT